MKNSENTPKIYVGTYGMYNSGSLFGKWFDLSDYTDTEEFLRIVMSTTETNFSAAAADQS